MTKGHLRYDEIAERSLILDTHPLSLETPLTVGILMLTHP